MDITRSYQLWKNNYEDIMQITHQKYFKCYYSLPKEKKYKLFFQLFCLSLRNSLNFFTTKDFEEKRI